MFGRELTEGARRSVHLMCYPPSPFPCSKGLQMLPKALAGTMKEQIRTGWTLQSLAKAADGTFELTYR